MRKLAFKPRSIRGQIYKLHKDTKSSHVASSLSCVEILMAITRVMGQGDELILSKGHAINCLYAIWGIEDVSDKPRMATRGHCVNVSSGSLGMGLSIGCGVALANRDKMVFVVMGDGECQEGQVWEALAFASHHKLKNLRVVIDRNGWQGLGKTEDILSLNPLDKRINSFGWDTRTCYGHDLEELTYVFRAVSYSKKPVAIIANTTKGKGFKYMEDSNEYHYRCPQ